jgi:poly-gamma-glutamate synthesis protein (capsule biosynthesis protein)
VLLFSGVLIAIFEKVEKAIESHEAVILVDGKEDVEEKNNTIKISFAGDCTIGYDERSSYAYSLPFVLEKQNNNYGYFFEKVKPVFEKDDLTIVNLENPFTTSIKRRDKQFCFKGELSYANILRAGSIEMVNIANNHIYDYSKEGFLDTIQILKNANIYYSGENYIAYYEVRDITIASIGYRGWSTYIKPNVSRDIKKAKEKADIVLVSFHWGDENKNYPNDVQKNLGRFAIDEGADIVVGHHPHVIQGIEKYKGKYIVYSLGNFCFGGNKNPRDKDTFIFQGEFTVIDKKITKIQGNIIPCSISSVNNINNYQPTILEGDEKQRVLNRIYDYSNKLKYGISPREI